MDSTEPSSNGNIQNEKDSKKKDYVSLMGLFGAADKLDCFLMILGGLGACTLGATLPLFFVFFGKMLDSIGNLSTDPKALSSRVSKNALDLVYLGLVTFLSAWIGVACWTQTGERQTARLRINYLKAVLAKDITFFDTEARDSNLIFHISSDAILVQDAIGDKTGHVLRYLSQFVAGFVVGFFVGMATNAAHVSSGSIDSNCRWRVRYNHVYNLREE